MDANRIFFLLFQFYWPALCIFLSWFFFSQEILPNYSIVVISNAINQCTRQEAPLLVAGMYKFLCIFTTIINIYLIKRTLMQKYFHVSLLNVFLIAFFCSGYLKYFKMEV